MFEGARATGVDRVEIKLLVVSNVAAHHGTLNEVNILQRIAYPRRIMQILDG